MQQAHNASCPVAVNEKTDYIYTDKELQQLFGIDWSDSFARFQTASGVFTSPDPLAEKYYPLSPYAYCAGDPVNLVDPEGMTIYVKDYASQRNVLNTLSEADSKHIAFSKTGMVIVNSMHEIILVAFCCY